MDEERIKFVSAEELQSLSTKIDTLEGFRKNIYWGGSIIVFVLTVLGFSAWSSISSKIDELNKSAEKVENRYFELNKQIASTSSNNIAVNNQLANLSAEITQKHGELLKHFVELQTISAKARIESEKALNIAGLLADAVKNANLSAEKAERLVQQVQESANYSRKANDAIQESLKNLDSFLAEKIKFPSEPTKFKIDVTSYYGTFMVSKGNSIPYDRKIAGYEINSPIIIPPNCVAIITDTGYENTFIISEDIKSQVIIDGSGRYRSVRFEK